MSAELLEKINAMIIKLVNRDNIAVPTNYYLANLSNEEYEMTNKESVESSETDILSDSTQYFNSSMTDDNIKAEHCDISSNIDSLENPPRITSNEKENDATLAVKRSLKELFCEKECDWNPKEFTSAA
ncbi:1408_t:CDS:2, partial [Racocetra persica]